MAKKSPLKPLGTRVLLREIEEDNKESGILLPDEAKGGGGVRRAEVLAVGSAVGSEEEKIALAVGDNVLLDSFAGKEVEVKGEEYLIAKSTDILAILS